MILTSHRGLLYDAFEVRQEPKHEGKSLLTTPTPSGLKLSAKVCQLYRRGKIGEALDSHYEDLVRTKTAGRQGVRKYIEDRGEIVKVGIGE